MNIHSLYPSHSHHRASSSMPLSFTRYFNPPTSHGCFQFSAAAAVGTHDSSPQQHLNKLIARLPTIPATTANVIAPRYWYLCSSKNGARWAPTVLFNRLIWKISSERVRVGGCQLSTATTTLERAPEINWLQQNCYDSPMWKAIRLVSTSPPLSHLFPIVTLRFCVKGVGHVA